MSPLRSSAGPAVCTKGTSSSAAMICASDVLPRPGRPGEQHVVERLAARGRRLDGDLQLLAHAVLADELVERCAGAASGRARPRPPATPGGVDALDGVNACAPPAARWPAAPRPSRPRRASSSACASAGGSRARAARRGRACARVVAARDGDRRRRGRAARRPSRAARRRSARPCACRCPGTACRRATSPAASAPTSSRGVPPLSTASATFGPTDCTPMSSRKRSRSSSVAKP